MQSTFAHRVLRRAAPATIASSFIAASALALPNGWTSFTSIGPPIDPVGICFYHKLSGWSSGCFSWETWQRDDCSLELICRTSNPTVCVCSPPSGWRPFLSALNNAYNPSTFPVRSLDWTLSEPSNTLNVISPLSFTGIVVYNLTNSASVGEYSGGEAGSQISLPLGALQDDVPYAAIGLTPDGRMQGFSAFIIKKGPPRQIDKLGYDVTWETQAVSAPLSAMIAYTSPSEACVISQMPDLSLFADVTTHNAFACAGDFNHDSLVDDMDFISFVPAYNTLLCDDPSMAEDCPSDLNGDGYVDDADFSIFVQAYNSLICP